MFPVMSAESLCEVRSLHQSAETTDLSQIASFTTASESFPQTTSTATLIPRNSDTSTSITTSGDKRSSISHVDKSSKHKQNDCEVIEMEAISTRILPDTGGFEPSLCLSTSALSNISEGPICRICHDGEDREDLISPCHCTGTVGLLHLSCLEKWLGSSSRTKCELCGFEYTLDSHPKPFKEWLRNPASPNDQRNLICDVACFVLLTPLATISSWLCMIGAQYYSYWAGRWEVPGLISLTVFLLCIYLTWCVVVVRYHYRVWADWRKHNQIVRIRAVKAGKMGSGNHLTEDNTTNSQRNSRDNSQTDLHSDVNSDHGSDSNNNAHTGPCISLEAGYDEDVVVEITGGSGRRGSYKLLSDSSNLLCSPNKRDSGVVSPRRSCKLSPFKTKPIRSSGSSPVDLMPVKPPRCKLFGRSDVVPNDTNACDLLQRSDNYNNSSPTTCTEISVRTSSPTEPNTSAPLLPPGLEVARARPVNRSLLHEPEFKSVIVRPPRASLVTYQTRQKESFSTQLQSCNPFSTAIVRNGTARETYV